MNAPQQSRKVQDWLRSLPTDGSTAARPIVERDGPRHKIEGGVPPRPGRAPGRRRCSTTDPQADPLNPDGTTRHDARPQADLRATGPWRGAHQRCQQSDRGTRSPNAGARCIGRGGRTHWRPAAPSSRPHRLAHRCPERNGGAGEADSIRHRRGGGVLDRHRTGGGSGGRCLFTLRMSAPGGLRHGIIALPGRRDPVSTRWSSPASSRAPPTVAADPTAHPGGRWQTSSAGSSMPPRRFRVKWSSRPHCSVVTEPGAVTPRLTSAQRGE